MNLSGTVTIAFNSIDFGPIAKNTEMNNQQNKLEKNKGPAKADGSPFWYI
tara:strand:- start:516 stop:665 length:150 start_codon:yes stop_codon:yes gene_type:complete